MSQKISTYRTYLGIAEEVTDANRTAHPTAFKKLIDITSIPDLQKERDQIEVTTLSDSAQKFIPGIRSSDNLTFEGYYDHARFAALDAIKDKEYWYGVFFGGTGDDENVTGAGTDGAFTFTGYATPVLAGAGTNEGVPMNVVVTPTSVIYDDTSKASIASVKDEYASSST